MQRSKFDIGRADAGAGGMSNQLRLKWCVWHGRDASAMAHSTGSSGAGSGSMCLQKSSSRARSAADSSTASLKWASLWARNGRHPVVQALFSSQRSASCPFGRRLAPPCFVHGQAFQGAIEDGAGKGGARLRLDAALEAAEDGHVAGLQVRRASWREEAQHDVRESGPHGGQGGLAGVDAGQDPQKDPRLSILARVHHVIQGGRELQDRGRCCPAVL